MNENQSEFANRKAGAPRLPCELKRKRCTITITDEVRKKAMLIGNGVVSAGVTKALENYQLKQNQTDNYPYGITQPQKF